jgi:hypothetical protein
MHANLKTQRLMTYISDAFAKNQKPLESDKDWHS